MIKNIVFDMGKVLVNNEYENTLAKHTTLDRFEYFIKEVYMKDEWQMLDMGTISYDDALDVMCSGKSDSDIKVIKEIMENQCVDMTVQTNLVKVVSQLKQNGYKLYILSNTQNQFVNYLKTTDSYLKYFDGMVFSCEEHTGKPDELLYKILFKRYSLSPCECLFIDDKVSNIETGRRLGMQGIIYDDFDVDNLIKQMKKFGINI